MHLFQISSKKISLNIAIFLQFCGCHTIFAQENVQSNSNDDKPLVFVPESDMPRRLKVFWNPTVAVTQINRLSSRDVRFRKSKLGNGILDEVHSSWRTLVAPEDDDDGTKRYIFLKMLHCDELDWQVEWTDADGVRHGPLVQRLEPSPQPWNPANVMLKVDRSTQQYDKNTDTIHMKIDWVNDEQSDLKLPGQHLLSVRPKIDLKSCEYLFRQPQPPPKLDDFGNLAIAGVYARYGCSFTVRLRAMTLNETLACRELHETNDFHSITLRLRCKEFPGLECPRFQPPRPKNDCEMDCQPYLYATADYSLVHGVPRPHILLDWASAIQQQPIFGSLVRYAQVDRTYLNYPIREYNVTELRVSFGGDGRPLNLEEYTRDEMASYKVQICVLHGAACASVSPDWTEIGERSVKIGSVIAQLPSPAVWLHAQEQRTRQRQTTQIASTTTTRPINILKSSVPTELPKLRPLATIPSRKIPLVNVRPVSPSVDTSSRHFQGATKISFIPTTTTSTTATTTTRSPIRKIEKPNVERQFDDVDLHGAGYPQLVRRDLSSAAVSENIVNYTARFLSYLFILAFVGLYF